MKRHTSLIPFSKHHHQALILGQILQKNSPPYENIPHDPKGKKEYFVSQHLDLLQYHFDMEENLLFPFISNLTDDFRIFIDEIISEHRRMEILFEKIQNETDTEESEDQLGKMLIAHVRKEERILFEDIQNKLNENQLEELTKLTAGLDSTIGNCKI
jgi:iron-sulfur cluster repair protein YtfE (RIC family)